MPDSPVFWQNGIESNSVLDPDDFLPYPDPTFVQVSSGNCFAEICSKKYIHEPKS
jgi:hypothetical protein